MIKFFLLLSVATMCGLFNAGCASSWESTYAPAGPAAAPLPPQQAIKMHDVSWQRLDAALLDLEAERAASDAPPDEWPADKKLAAKQKLLTALQITADASNVEILGRSTFRTTTPLDPKDGQLAAFARKIGADTVVWSSNYLGKAQIVRDEPVSEWRTGTWSSTDRSGRRRYNTYTENSTIWVPVVVEADEHAFLAYFLRETPKP